MNWYKKAQQNIEFNSDVGIHTIKLGPATIIYQINENGVVNLSSLRVPQKYRRKGFSKNILTEFTKWLDKANLSSTLGASPLDKKTSPSRLEKLYHEFGYNPTGKYINPAFDKEMKRDPNNELV
jgi:hypothetical protein